MINPKFSGSLILLVLIFVSGTAYADRSRQHSGRSSHGRVGIGLYFGMPYSYPYYPFPYYPYSYYPPPVVVTPSQPPIYIEQSPSETTKSIPRSYYWYYCDKSDGYYPYVKECPSGWERVLPTPPTEPQP